MNNYNRNTLSRALPHVSHNIFLMRDPIVAITKIIFQNRSRNTFDDSSHLFRGMLRIIATTGFTGTHSHEAAIEFWLDCARWCRRRRRRDGVSLTRGPAIVCGLVLPIRPMAFYAKGPVCRYCHAARGRNLSITSLRHSVPDASLRKLGGWLERS